jgi:amino acid transporter
MKNMKKFISTKKSGGSVNERVSINRRIYKLFLKNKKWTFIIVSGLYCVAPTAIVLFFSVIWSVYQFNLKLEAYLIFIGIILGGIIYAGYKNYIKYSSLDMDSEVVQYHYKEILNEEI